MTAFRLSMRHRTFSIPELMKIVSRGAKAPKKNIDLFQKYRSPFILPKYTVFFGFQAISSEWDITDNPITTRENAHFPSYLSFSLVARWFLRPRQRTGL